MKVQEGGSISRFTQMSKYFLLFSQCLFGVIKNLVVMNSK